MAKKTVLAIDLGAESGRVMAVHFDGQALSMETLHRFSNPVTTINGTLHWDMLHLWREITAGIEAGRHLQPASIGVDTWAVDFGLLDAAGNLIGNPVCYRDARTDGMMALAFETVPRTDIFAVTGIQFLPFNSLYQLLSLVHTNAPQLAIAETFLTIPDLLNYWLTGTKACEFSNGTTTQMLNPLTGAWANGMLDALQIPTGMLPEIIPSGTTLGSYEGIPVIAPATHDTGSAVAAIPLTSPYAAYISSGTWSLVGLEGRRPLLSPAALAANLTNEGGVYGTWRHLKNVMGLWIVQQCRATWERAGRAYTYGELMALGAAEPAGPIIDVNDQRFLPPGDHPTLVKTLCHESGQTLRSGDGPLIRCVLDSLAAVYNDVVEQLVQVAERPVDAIHIVGGGSQNELLNQLTANATGRPVISGPVEATVLGNAVVQLISLGEIDDLATGRRLIGQMAGSQRYEPAG